MFEDERWFLKSLVQFPKQAFARWKVRREQIKLLKRQMEYEPFWKSWRNIKRMQALLDDFRYDPPDHIARRLLEGGYLGIPGTIGNCPLTAYLSWHYCPAIANSCVITRKKDIAVIAFRSWGYGHKANQISSLKLPKNLTDFVIKFDEYKYPFLVSRNGTTTTITS